MTPTKGARTMNQTEAFSPLTDSNDPRVVALLAAWHENGREYFERHYPNLDYDSPAYAKVARPRRKYICLDEGTGGVMMVEKETGQVFGIKAYGVIHRGHPCGHIEELTKSFIEATEHNRKVFNGARWGNLNETHAPALP